MKDEAAGEKITQANFFNYVFDNQLADDEDGDCTPRSLSIDDEMLSQLLASILALYSLTGVGFNTICRAYDTGFLFDIWTQDGDLTSHPFITGRASSVLREFAKDPRRLSKEKASAFTQEMENAHTAFTMRGHRDYPQSFLKLENPPRWLFIQGSVEVLNSRSIIAVVGTRQASEAGIQLARKVSACLVKGGAVVLSGLAKGIDEAAHQGCLEKGGKTIAVLGHGLHYSRLANAVVQLKSGILEHGGVLVSEYMPDDPPSRRSYLRRNALQVALSRAVIPIEFPKRKSGTGSSILRAKELNVPLVGFFPTKTTENSLLATRDNFITEEIRFYEVDEDVGESVAKLLNNVLS